MQFRKWLIALLVALLPLFLAAQGTAPGILLSNQLGAANGVAPLDGTSKVPLGKLPTGTSSTTLALGTALQPATMIGIVASSGSAFRAATLSDLTGLGAVSASAPNITAALSQNSAVVLNIANGTLNQVNPTINCSSNCDTLVGAGAGSNLPPADFLTTAIGFNALHFATASRTESTAVGFAAGQNITGIGPGVNPPGFQGYFLSIFGVAALDSCTTGCYLATVLGGDAAALSTALTNSIVIGNAAAQFSNADQSVLIGVAAGGGNSSAIPAITSNVLTSVLIGQQAGQGITATTVSDLVGIGDHALFNITTASRGVAIGADVGRAATTDTEFVWGGWKAAGNTSGSLGTVILGYNAVNSANTFSGTNVNVIGNSAGTNLTTGYALNILGANSCPNATTSFNITCIGDAVGQTVTTGAGLLLISSGVRPVEPPAPNWAMNIENIITTTGILDPPTSVTKIAGIENVVGARQANGTAGVTCSGTPTSSFATINGLVTHC